jgi:hypothetical protein
MAKNRQIETDLFSQGWFYELSNEAKVLYVYCYLNSDNAGIIELIKRRIEYDLQIDLEKAFFEIQSEFTALGNGRFLIKRVIRTQCPNGLAHDGRFQSSVIKLLENEGIDTETYEPSKALPKPLESLTKALPKAHSHSHSLSNSHSQGQSNSQKGEKIEKKSKRTKTTMTDDEYGRMMISKGFKCYGEFGNVFLSEKNVEDAIEKVGTFVLKRATESLSAYKELKPDGAQHYTKDYAVMCSWVFDKVKLEMQKEGLNWREYWGREMRERENAKAKLKDPLFNSEQNGTT